MAMSKTEQVERFTTWQYFIPRSPYRARDETEGRLVVEGIDQKHGSASLHLRLVRTPGFVLTRAGGTQ